MYDIIIVGAGPAGLTAALYARRAGHTVLILEGGVPGGQAATTPNVENWPGTPAIGGADFAMNLYQQVQDLGITERAKLGISYGFQQPARFKGMKVSDLLECAAGKKLTREESCHYLAQVGLCSQEYVDRDVDASLSGGELKRIEIATILARNAPLMIFDEPEAGIDLWSFGRLTETFQAIHRQHKASMIIISHQERIIRLADEVVLISGGTVAGQGPASELLEQIESASLNGGSCTTCM